MLRGRGWVVALGLFVVAGVVAGLVVLAVRGNPRVCDTALSVICPRATQSAGVGTAPDPGSIWFGQSFDRQTFALSGRSTTFAKGVSVALVAHLTRTSTGETLGLLVLGGGFLGTTGLGQIPAGQDVIGHLLAPSDLGGPGSYSVSVVDESGAHLADGTITVSP